MNWMKKGPDLKLAEIKVPDFLHDLYHDLKDRHLLPLVAVLVVAIVAIPIALSQSSNSEEAEPGATASTLPAAGGSGSGTLVVAKSAPGLRDYHRRLKRAQAADPFKQQYQGGTGEGAETSTSASEAGAPVEESFETSAATEAVPTESESGTGGSTRSAGAKYATTAIDVRIVTVPDPGQGANSKAKPETEVRHGLPELTMLPSRETPAATFMGTSSNGKKALFVVSSDVVSIFGDGQCVVGSQTCQLLALEAGLPETFVYGPQGRTYRIEVMKIEKTLSATPRRAPLGAPKKKRKGDRETKPASEAPTGAG